MLNSNNTPTKPLEYEGRGTVTCHLCPRNFTLKKLLSRHYVSSHG